ncbi:MAG: alanine--tRNA ligase, partial [bacterium]|nr:alanine--tRNA ligase [bacterium]
QKCVRTGDIDEVGDSTHHTFFEMLGNWSLGDYFKKEAIEMSWEYLTEVLKLKKSKLAVSVFAGDEDAPFDEEAYNLWLKLGIPAERIAKLGKDDNWWGPAGETGPCGPDTEIFYWVGDKEVRSKKLEVGSDEVPDVFDPQNSGWVEIWNDVFMQYNKTKDGAYVPLAQKNVDTGMGLERTLAVINGLDDNYQTELFLPIIEKIEKLSGKKYNESQEIKRAMRIIADHIKAAVMILGDTRGVGPANTGAGYVLRRLIRRAVRYAKQLNINSNFTATLADVVVAIYKNIYPELQNNEKFIKDELQKEEEKFRAKLEQGEKMFQRMSSDKRISGTEAFILFSTYGFPFELTQELAKENGYTVDEKEFQAEMKKHTELSQTASAGMFKGGLADASDETKRLHTAAHLMLESLRRVLGPHVQQKGSNITAERLRFDVSHPEKITPEQIKQIEDIVNEQIKKDLPVWFEEMPLDEARKINATGVFEHKYGEKVKVYFVGKGAENFSKEICGGPHVTHTGELAGAFKIIKEESSSAGVRRIKAILK